MITAEQRAIETAFASVMDLENPLAELKGFVALLRMCAASIDETPEEALYVLGKTIGDLVERAEGQRGVAFEALHPLIFKRQDARPCA